MNIFAIDPGPIKSAFCTVDVDTLRPVAFDKIPNRHLLASMEHLEYNTTVIERVASYGMPVGAEVFDTCIWIGMFQREAEHLGSTVRLYPRAAVKRWLCHDSRAKDGNIRQALVDRFAPGQPNHGKGTKAAPGWFYGFAADVWQAYALAVTTLGMVAMIAEPMEGG